MTLWLRGGAVSYWLLIGLVLVWILFAPPSAVGDRIGWRAFLTPPVTSDYYVTQRFQMNRDGLTAVEVYPAAVGPVSGRYTLSLRDSQAADVTRLADVAAADLVANDSYTFRFAPVAASAGHEFFLDIAPAPDNPGRGIAFWATKGDRLDEGELRVNGRPRWASLAFQTHTPAVSLFRSLTRGREPERLPPWLALVGLAASWISLRFILRTLAHPDEHVAHPATLQPSSAALTPGVMAAQSASSANTPPSSDLEAPPAAAR